MKTDAKEYLEYLDKEMTIMGILSAVSLAAPAGILNTFMSDKGDLKAQIWEAGRFFVTAGSLLCVLAAFFFYMQRSRLAQFYGHICLVKALGEDPPAELLRDANSWKTYLPYCWGFTALVTGFIEYLLAFAWFLAPPILHLSPDQWRIWKIVTFCFCLIIAAIAALLQKHVLQKHVRVKYRFRSRLPHANVYTRLKPSLISGIGVFAICDIPKGTYVFGEDDDEVKSVNKSEIENLSPAMRRLYEDFCVLRDNIYQCPTNFNKLTPSWFLNNSEQPNVAADSSLRFYALREIKAGEEVTANYDSYSENKLSADT